MGSLDDQTTATSADQHPRSSIRWARWGFISKLIALALKPRKPSILILSFPRSGSSWVGETLGRAPDALYLREPVTQSDATFYDRGTVFALDTPDVRTAYRRLADKAFIGWPDFGDHIVRFPGQWALRWRRPRRLVIKAVNPLACDWYLRRYKPHVLFLVRHPAAVALSLHTQGWLGIEPQDWAENGAFQARALHKALEALSEYPAHTTIRYETLCADPEGGFERLYGFADLMWTSGIQAIIRTKTSAEDETDLWQTSRHSKHMIEAWRGRVPKEVLGALRTGYRRFNLPWYQWDKEW